MPDSQVSPFLDRAAALSWRFLVVVAAVAVLAWGVVELRLVVLPVILALFVTTLLAPPTVWLKRRGWPPALATSTTFLGALLLVAALWAVLVPQFVAGLGPLAESVLEAIERLKRWLAAGPLHLTEQDLDRYLRSLTEQARENVQGILGGVLGGAALAVEIVAGLAVVAVVVFFFLKDGERMVAWGLGLVDGAHRERVDRLAERAWRTMSAYIRGLAVVGLVDAVLIGIGLLILGVPLVVPLAVLVFFGAFLPLVGAFLSGLLAVLVALVSDGFVKALVVTALVVGVQQVEGNVLAPLVLGRAVQLHPLAIVLVLTAGAVVAGVIGAFLAVPVAAVGVAIGSELRREADRGPSPGEPEV